MDDAGVTQRLIILYDDKGGNGPAWSLGSDLGGTILCMLTRAQVAERLGKSVATVRRLQLGGELNSRRDSRGVHLFEEWEVAELVERYSSGERITAARSGSISTSRIRVGGVPSRVGDGDDAEIVDLRRENAELRGRLDVARSAVELLVEQGLTDEVFDLFDAAL